jgi:uncharacterized protein (DUF433 family)
MTTPVDIGTLIVRTPGTVGGRPRIDGTRIAVEHIAVMWNHGYSAEDIVYTKYTHLTLHQVYAALAYYHANKAEIDSSIAEEGAFVERIMREKAEEGHRASKDPDPSG